MAAARIVARFCVVGLAVAIGCRAETLPRSAFLADAGDAAAADALQGDVAAADLAPSADAAARGDDAAVAPGLEITLPAGTFYMGSTQILVGAGLALDDEVPQHPVTVSAFALDRHEVTQGQYTQCVTAGACSVPGTTVTSAKNCTWGIPGLEDHPLNCLTWPQAEQYCAWAGRRLPTEAEWEYAARGADKTMNPQLFPWGNAAATCELAVMKADGAVGCGSANTWPVCSKSKGNSPQGACDLAGSLWEFVADTYTAYPASPQTNPKALGGSGRVMRGGAQSTPAEGVRAAIRAQVAEDKRFSDVGFRCARSL